MFYVHVASSEISDALVVLWPWMLLFVSNFSVQRIMGRGPSGPCQEVAHTNYDKAHAPMGCYRVKERG